MEKPSGGKCPAVILIPVSTVSLMKIFNRKITAEWEHIAFITAIALITAFYLYDVVNVSMNRNNVILVLPLAILVLGLCVILLIKAVRIETVTATKKVEVSTESSADPETGEVKQTPANVLRALAMLVLLGAYVFTYPFLGLDVATFFFVFISLVLLGHRNWFFVLTYSLIFTFVVIGGSLWLLSYPMPMSIL